MIGEIFQFSKDGSNLKRGEKKQPYNYFVQYILCKLEWRF